MSAAEADVSEGPQPDPEPLAAPLAEALAAAHQRVAAAEARLQAGEAPALAGLPDEIGRLCERAAALPPDQQRAARPLLQHLIRELDHLREALLARAPASAPGPETL